VERLARPGLIREAGQEHSSTGPVRQLCEITPAGRELAGARLGRPARHGRDVRSELLVKLALLDRAGANASDLVRAQRDQLAPIAGGLEERLRSAEGSERTVMLWRREAISATLRFLDALEEQPSVTPGGQPPMADMGRAGCRNPGSLMPCPGSLAATAPRQAAAS
jgi:hypothetical protein